VLTGPQPYPMVVLPRRGGYWVEGAGSESPTEFSSLSLNGGCTPATMPKPKIDQDETALAYRKYFIGKVSKSNTYSEFSGGRSFPKSSHIGHGHG